MNTHEQDLRLSVEIARRVAAAGGRAMYVGGMVRDQLMGVECKDIDIEVYGLVPRALKDVLSALGRVMEMGASFGVYGLQHSTRTRRPCARPLPRTNSLPRLPLLRPLVPTTVGSPPSEDSGAGSGEGRLLLPGAGP